MYCQYIDSVNNPGARFYLNVFKAKVEHFGKEGLFTSCLQEDFVTIRQRPARLDVPPLRRIGGSGEPHRGKLWSKVDQFVFVSHKSNSTFSCLLSFLDTFTAPSTCPHMEANCALPVYHHPPVGVEHFQILGESSLL